MSAIDLYPYQQRWLKDKSRFKIAMWSRQIGKTFATDLGIVDNCMEAASQGRKERWVILSRGERQAKESIEEHVKVHAKAYGITLESLEYDFDGGETSYKAMDVLLPNGSKITALPANPDTARGFSANVYLDEFAFHKDSRKIWQALFPVISKGWKLQVSSTPNGKNNKFYDLITSKDPQWSKHFCNIYEAVKQGLDRDIEALRAGCDDEETWQQEFCCEFLDEATAWLTYDLINGCEQDGAGEPDKYLGGDCYIGIDIGRKQDLWAAWVWEKIGDVLWCREIRTLKNKSFAEQEENLNDLMVNYQVKRVAMDETGMGMKPVEDAKRRYGKYKVEGVIFTSSSKQELAILGKQAFEDRTVRIPLGDPVLRSDLHKLRKMTTPMGNVRFDADRDSSGHADRTWACFLGIYAAGNKKRLILPQFMVHNGNTSTVHR
jgi:phage FluMu gp28-like protein